MTDLGITTRAGAVDPTCTARGFLDSSSFSGGVVCYNETTVGSTAVYVCSDTFILMDGDEERMCESNSMWNGRTPLCISQESGIYFINLKISSTLHIVHIQTYFTIN